jgi:hypothetical protein
MAVQPIFFDFEGFEKGLADGSFLRRGQKIHDGQTWIRHLPEVTPDNEVLRQISELLQGKKKVNKEVAIGLSVALGALLIAGGGFWIARVRAERKLKVAIAKYNAALSDYLVAVATSGLKEVQLSSLITALHELRSVKGFNKSQRLMSSEVLKLTNVVVEYTNSLAKLNGVNISDLPELAPGEAEKFIDDLVTYLEVQRQIIKD